MTSVLDLYIVGNIKSHHQGVPRSIWNYIIVCYLRMGKYNRIIWKMGKKAILSFLKHCGDIFYEVTRHCRTPDYLEELYNLWEVWGHSPKCQIGSGSFRSPQISVHLQINSISALQESTLWATAESCVPNPKISRLKLFEIQVHGWRGYLRRTKVIAVHWVVGKKS